MSAASPWAAPPPGSPAPAGTGTPGGGTTRVEQVIALTLALVLVVAVQVVLDRRGARRPAQVAAPAPTVTALPPSRVVTPRRPVRTPVRPSVRPVRPTAPPPAAAAAPSVPRVPVTGRVLDAQGRGVPGVVVLTRRHVGGLEALFTGLTAAFTLGLACLADVCGTDEVRAVTDGTGRFRLRVPLSGQLGAVGEHDLVAAVPSRTPRVPQLLTTARYDFTGRAQDVGVVNLWRPDLRLTRPGGALRADFSRLPASYGDDVRYNLEHVDASGAVGYRSRDVQPGQEVDGRLVERGLTGALVVATAEDARGRPVEHRAAPAPVPAGPLPVSRGATCARYRPDGRTVAVPSCPWTDGRLAAEVGPRGTPAGACRDGSAPGCKGRDGALLLDLSRTRTVSLVVLRGCTFDCTVQTSTDGRTFTERAVTEFGHDDDVALELDPVPARYVRVLYSFVLDMSSAAEVSVF